MSMNMDFDNDDMDRGAPRTQGKKGKNFMGNIDRGTVWGAIALGVIVILTIFSGDRPVSMASEGTGEANSVIFTRTQDDQLIVNQPGQEPYSVAPGSDTFSRSVRDAVQNWAAGTTETPVQRDYNAQQNEYSIMAEGMGVQPSFQQCNENTFLPAGSFCDNGQLVGAPADIGPPPANWNNLTSQQQYDWAKSNGWTPTVGQ